MHIPRTARIVLVSLVIVVAMGAVCVWTSLPQIEKWGVGFHQKSVTRSLAQWAIEDANITNNASAIHAAEMIRYMGSYYVPSPGYRGPAQVEAALENQRRKSIGLVAASLERYTGLDYGTNVERWTDWAEKRKSSEQDGPANGSQTIRAETNSPSSTAGSRR